MDTKTFWDMWKTEGNHASVKSGMGFSSTSPRGSCVELEMLDNYDNTELEWQGLTGTQVEQW